MDPESGRSLPSVYLGSVAEVASSLPWAGWTVSALWCRRTCWSWVRHGNGLSSGRSNREAAVGASLEWRKAWMTHWIPLREKEGHSE